ncbi:hypothetical protein AVEN_50834-1, partial [Araneus ventricosus]
KALVYLDIPKGTVFYPYDVWHEQARQHRPPQTQQEKEQPPALRYSQSMLKFLRALRTAYAQVTLDSDLSQAS